MLEKKWIRTDTLLLRASSVVHFNEVLSGAQKRVNFLGNVWPFWLGHKKRCQPTVSEHNINLSQVQENYNPGAKALYKSPESHIILRRAQKLKNIPITPGPRIMRFLGLGKSCMHWLNFAQSEYSLSANLFN